MRRIKLIVPANYHPDAGGIRRRGEVFDLADGLAEHWIVNALAEDATGEELTAPLVPIEPLGPGLWPDGSEQDEIGEATDEGAVINSDERPAGTPMPATVGPTRQKRGR